MEEEQPPEGADSIWLEMMKMKIPEGADSSWFRVQALKIKIKKEMAMDRDARLKLEEEMELKAQMETEADVIAQNSDAFEDRDNSTQEEVEEEEEVEYLDVEDLEGEVEVRRTPDYLQLGFFHDKTMEYTAKLQAGRRVVKSHFFYRNQNPPPMWDDVSVVIGAPEYMPMKSVYLCVKRGASDFVAEDESFNMSWFAVDLNHRRRSPQGKKMVPLLCLDDEMKNASPGQVWDLIGYGCAVWNSKIVIAGGKIKGVPSNKVFVYDTSSKTWEPTRQMMTERGENPTIVPTEDKLFIFGGAAVNVPLSLWGESYDSDSDSCSSSQCAPFSLTTSLEMFPKIISHAVLPKKELIMFWMDPRVLWSFNYRECVWTAYETPSQIAKDPRWNEKVVVLEDFLFWYYGGTIYAKDMRSHVTIPAYTFPHSGFSKVFFYGDGLAPSFLVHLGEGKLCLLHQVENRIRYYTFLVVVAFLHCGGSHLRTDLACSGFLQTPLCCDIVHALEFSA